MFPNKKSKREENIRGSVEWIQERVEESKKEREETTVKTGTEPILSLSGLCGCTKILGETNENLVRKSV